MTPALTQSLLGGSSSLLGRALALTAIPGFLAPSTSATFPSVPSLLDLLPPFLLAVPKKKTSHSRKAMRSANKGLKDKGNIVHCPACGTPKLAHHLCVQCYTTLNRAWKKNPPKVETRL